MEDIPSFQLQRKGGLPIYLQVKRKIERLIASGHWEKGQRLPAERALAEELEVSRNTVSLAYRQLEAEGLVTSRQGRGTFVAEADDLVRLENRRDRLARIIDSALEDAGAMGISLDEFMNMAVRRTEERRKMLQEVRIAFVECNREQLDYFSKELELGTGVRVLPVLTDELVAGEASARATIASADLIVTTFFHLDEVRALFPARAEDILGIALDPVIETIVRIARLPQNCKVLLVCLSTRFAERVCKSMDLAGITEVDVEITTSKDPEELRAKLVGKRAVIVSPGRMKEVVALVRRGTPCIEFVYKLDAGSVNLLGASVIERRKKNRQGGTSGGSRIDVEGDGQA